MVSKRRLGRVPEIRESIGLLGGHAQAGGGRDIAGRNMGVPCHAVLGLIVRRLARNGRYVDEDFAGRTGDLAAGELFLALHVLSAVRTGEFEVAHRI